VKARLYVPVETVMEADRQESGQAYDDWLRPRLLNYWASGYDSVIVTVPFPDGWRSFEVGKPPE
jgi:hypothetical protein